MRFRMRVSDESLLDERTVDEIRERKEERVREARVDAGGADRDWEEGPRDRPRSTLRLVGAC